MANLIKWTGFDDLEQPVARISRSFYFCVELSRGKDVDFSVSFFFANVNNGNELLACSDAALPCVCAASCSYAVVTTANRMRFFHATRVRYTRVEPLSNCSRVAVLTIAVSSSGPEAPAFAGCRACDGPQTSGNCFVKYLKKFPLL